MSGPYCLDEEDVRAMSEKISAMSRWLNKNAPYCETSQKHLDEGTIERAYWHYGYVCGARDFLALLDRRSSQ